jgi:hypothetical protein
VCDDMSPRENKGRSEQKRVANSLRAARLFGTLRTVLFKTNHVHLLMFRQ